MAKLFSVASWNVEHLKDDLSRVGRVVQFLKDQNPDVLPTREVAVGEEKVEGLSS